MNKIEMYLQAYKKLNNVTPLRKDCGLLCEKACCRNEIEEGRNGMYLFPGEEELLKAGPWSEGKLFSVQETKLEWKQGRKTLLINCGGNCDRDSRPLSCRLFPLFPYINSDGILLLKMDIRGMSVCPLVQCLDKKDLNQEFVKTVRETMDVLIRDPDIHAFLDYHSRILDETEEILERFNKSSAAKKHYGRFARGYHNDIF